MKLNGYDLVCRQMIADFDVLFEEKLADLKNFNERIEAFYRSNKLESFEECLKVSHQVEKEIERIIKDLRDQSIGSKEDSLHEVLLANIAKEISKPKVDVATVHSLVIKNFSVTYGKIQKVKKKCHDTELSLRNFNDRIRCQWETISEEKLQQKADCLSQKLISTIDAHAVHINNISKRVIEKLQRQHEQDQKLQAHNDHNTSLSPASKLKVTSQEIVRPRRLPDRQSSHLAAKLSRRFTYPIAHCGLAASTVYQQQVPVSYPPSSYSLPDSGKMNGQPKQEVTRKNAVSYQSQIAARLGAQLLPATQMTA